MGEQKPRTENMLKKKLSELHFPVGLSCVMIKFCISKFCLFERTVRFASTGVHGSVELWDL